MTFPHITVFCVFLSTALVEVRNLLQVQVDIDEEDEEENDEEEEDEVMLHSSAISYPVKTTTFDRSNSWIERPVSGRLVSTALVLHRILLHVQVYIDEEEDEVRSGSTELHIALFGLACLLPNSLIWRIWTS